MKKIYLLPALMFMLYACGGISKPAGLDHKLRAHVNSLNDTVHAFKMDVFEKLPMDWDRLTIVNPYTSRSAIAGLPYNNINSNLSAIHDYTYQEGLVQLILSKDNRIVSVDTVARGVIDFAGFRTSTEAKAIEVLTRKQVSDLIYTSTLNSGYIPVLINTRASLPKTP